MTKATKADENPDKDAPNGTAAGSKRANAKKPKAISDIAHPGTSTPSDTSKPIITHRAIMKDPMVVDGDDEPGDKDRLVPTKAGETKITPLGEKGPDEDKSPGSDAQDTAMKDGEPTAKNEPVADDASAAKEAPEPSDESPAQPKTVPAKDESKTDSGAASAADVSEDESEGAEAEADAGSETGDTKSGKGKKAKADEEEAKAAAQAEEEAKTRKLIESKQYFLPLNAVEHRKTARFAALGILLALILAVAWVDIALDAGLIHLGGIKPVTHLFTN